MPALAPQEVRDLIGSGKIKAITLDTTVFDQFGCNLTYQSLLALGQFRLTGVHVIFSEVILGEVTAHIARDAGDAAEKARASINQYIKAWRSDHDRTQLEAQLGLNASPAARAEALVSDYLERVNGERVPPEPGVSVAELVRRYFAPAPPFGGKDKKAEFPDAIALLSLETWARQHGGMVLAVSKDNDWERFAASSAHVAVVRRLPEALDAFNAASGVIATRVIERLRASQLPAVESAIRDALEGFLEEFDVDVTSSFFPEAEPASAVLKNWQVAPDSPAQIVAIDDERLTIAITVSANVEFSTHIRLSVWDGVDREYVSMGSAMAQKDEMVEVPVVFSVHRGEAAAAELTHLQATEVEVESLPLTIEFEDVEPDYWAN